jgi:hypothetical protein
MDYDLRSLSGILSAAELSFNPDLWQLPFTRTLPVAIYVDAGELSREVAEIIEERLKQELADAGFESFENLTNDYGSFLQLNLTRTPKTDDGPKTDTKLRRLRKRMVEYLRGEFFSDLKQAGKDVQSVLKVVISVGTIVILLTTVPTVGVTVGTFVISANVWALLGVAKETGDIMETTHKVFTDNKEAEAALRRPVHDSDPIFYSMLEHRIHEVEQKYEQKLREQEERFRAQLAQAVEQIRKSTPSGTPPKSG